ncbi:MAG: serine hydrolase domain-containing protein [Nitrospiria bacterium]
MPKVSHFIALFGGGGVRQKCGTPIKPVIGKDRADCFNFRKDSALSNILFGYPVWIFFFIFALAGCSTAPSRPGQIQKNDFQYTKQYLSWMIRHEMRKHDVKGLSIAIVDDQKIVWAEGFGYADADHHIPASPETIYPVGSITKVMTATEIMKLVELGKIELDKPVTDYLPDFSIRSRFGHTLPITPRSLLAHHSGLPADYLKGMWVEEPDSLSRLVEKLKEENLTSPPQTLYKYSNLDFSLLGRMIEKISGEEYETVMQRDLLQPLEMTHSSFELVPEFENYYAKGYRKGKEMRRLSFRDIPAGSMLSNVTDMAKFMRFIFAEGSAQETRVLSPETLKEMFIPQYNGLALDFGHEIGMAWMLNGLEVSGVKGIAWHDGGYPPYFGTLMILPDKKLGVVVLANTDEARNFGNQVSLKAMELALEAKYGLRPSQSPPPPQFKPVKIPIQTLQKYAGDYMVFGGLSAISQKGERLKIKAMGSKFDLVPINHDTFIPAKTLFGLISISLMNYPLQFETVEGRDVALLKGLPAPFPFEKIPHYLVPQAWVKRLGEYRMDKREEIFEIRRMALKLEGGVLFADINLSSDLFGVKDAETKIALQPVSDDEAVVVGLGYSEGGTLRAISENGEEKLVYSGFTFYRTKTNKKNSSIILKVLIVSRKSSRCE